MLAFAIRRTASAGLLIVFVSLISFLLIFAAGEPAASIVGQGGSARDVQAVSVALGLDRPIHEQYVEWLWRALRGDLGKSIRLDQPVAGVVADGFRMTFAIGALAMSLAVLVAVPLGIAAAKHQGKWIDRFTLLLNVVSQSMPSFCLALLAVIVLTVKLNWLPSSGTGSWQHFVLPVAALGFYVLPALLRLTRAGMIEVLRQDFIRTARAMGITERRILFKYALRNALVPVAVVAAAQFGYLLSGSVVIESVFAIYGAGRLALDSVLGGDLPVLQALVLGFSVIYVVLTLAADLLVAWLDPRLRK